MGCRSRSILLLFAVLIASAMNAQERAATSSRTDRKPAPVKYASIAGIVTNATGQPMRRGIITLTAHSTGVAGQSAETDEQGKFRFSAVTPGIYSISASRDGYITADFGVRGGIRMPRQFGIYESERWDDVAFRLDPWGVIAGRVKFGDDAEPAMRVPVFAYRKRYWHGAVEYNVAANARTDDRGEYRLSGLRPGNYIIAAIYDKPRKATASEETPAQNLSEVDQRIRDTPPSEPSYTSTFFTSATRISDAATIEVKSGTEMPGVDLFLTPAQSTRIRGRITDGCTGRPTIASIDVFRATDGDAAAVRANTQMTIGPTSFAVQGLAPGAYAMFVTKDADKDCPAQTYRRTFYVNESPFDNVEVTLRPLVKAEFYLRLDSPTPARQRLQIAAGIQLRLYPRYRQIRPVTLSFDQSGTATVLLDPNESYSVSIERGPADAYLEQPLIVDGAPGQFALTVSLRGARAAGQVTDGNDKPVPGASVTLIPESFARLAQPFPEGFAELDGGAFIQGIAPGSYVAVPWLDTPPCDFHSPGAYESCFPHGTRVELKAGEEKLIPLRMKLR